MGSFSASEAISSGFKLIARHPAALLYWAGAYLALAVLPQLLAVWSAAPDFIAFYQEAARKAAEGAGVGAAPDMTAMMRLQAHMAIIQPVIWLSMLASNAVVVGAIYRGVLYPEERRFGYLRLSSRELWLGLVMAVLYVGLIILLVALTIVAIVVIAVSATAAQHGGGGIVGVLIGVVLSVVSVSVVAWLALRFSLALPLSFGRDTFEIGDSWALTRGHAFKMFLVFLAVGVLVWLVELIVVGAGWSMTFAVVQHGRSWRDLTTEPPGEMLRAVLPWIPVWAVVGSLIAAAVYAVMAAPLADIYRQLTAPAAEPQSAA